MVGVADSAINLSLIAVLMLSSIIVFMLSMAVYPVLS